MEQAIKARLKYLRITPRKTRMVAETLKGLNVNEAKAQLMLSPRRVSQSLLKLLHSAIANAKNSAKLEAHELYIKQINVDQGPKYKRWMPRARGSASLLEKKTSHVTLVLGTSEDLKAPRFTFKEKIKKEKGSHKEKPAKEPKKFEGEKKPEAKTPKQPGFLPLSSTSRLLVRLWLDIVCRVYGK